MLDSDIEEWILRNSINPLKMNSKELKLFDLNFPQYNAKSLVESQKLRMPF